MFKAVIFDMDGVIIDSEPLHFKVDKKLLSKCGLEVDNEFLSQYVGVSNPEMLSDIKDKYHIKYSVDELLDIKLEVLLKALNESDLDTIIGIRQLIDDLKAHGIVLAIASSSPIEFIEAVIEKTNLQHHFNVVISGEQVEKSKPAPDVFLKAASLLCVNPDECVVIEDAEKGVEAALAAGMKCIGYVNHNSGNQDLSKASVMVADMQKIDYDYICGVYQLHRKP